jgi:alkylation response protein AidB-like acyl-CoA dehydrogenase
MQFGPPLAASVVGAARGAQQRFVELAAAKRPTGVGTVLAERAYAQMAVGEAEGLILAAEDTLAAAVRDVWSQGETTRRFDLDSRVRMRSRVVASVRLAARAVDLLHDAAGMNGVAVPSALERAWRDVHTASQHVLLSVARLEITGRALLGLDPGAPVI